MGMATMKRVYFPEAVLYAGLEVSNRFSAGGWRLCGCGAVLGVGFAGRGVARGGAAGFEAALRGAWVRLLAAIAYVFSGCGRHLAVEDLGAVGDDRLATMPMTSVRCAWKTRNTVRCFIAPRCSKIWVSEVELSSGSAQLGLDLAQRA
jgi:hypothetical protein